MDFKALAEAKLAESRKDGVVTQDFDCGADAVAFLSEVFALTARGAVDVSLNMAGGKGVVFLEVPERV